jgi:hypothetical protein
MKLKKHQLRKMILTEMRIINGGSSPMKSRAHPDLVRALKGESVDRPHPHSVRNIIVGLDQALSMPPTVGGSAWPPGVKSFNEMYPNLASHLRKVKDYLNGKSPDPGDIEQAEVSTLPTNMSSELDSVFDQASLTEEEVQDVTDVLSGDDDRFYGSSAYEKLLDYFSDEMPSGTMKGFDGEPDVWILDKLEALQDSR